MCARHQLVYGRRSKSNDGGLSSSRASEREGELLHPLSRNGADVRHTMMPSYGNASRPIIRPVSVLRPTKRVQRWKIQCGAVIERALPDLQREGARSVHYRGRALFTLSRIVFKYYRCSCAAPSDCGARECELPSTLQHKPDVDAVFPEWHEPPRDASIAFLALRFTL